MYEVDDDSEKLKAAESLSILETDILDASEILERDKGICTHKEAQINYMKNNNFESNIDSYNKFFSALDSLYNYYNDIIDK